MAALATSTVAAPAERVAYSAGQSHVWHAPLMLPPARPVPKSVEARLIVLMYHLVGPLPPHAQREAKNLTVSADRFETDLRELRAAGCHLLTMAHGYDLLAHRQLPRRAVVLTFDDGYENNYKVAWPLMRKYGYVGTFNIVYDSLSAPGHMDREQIKELAAVGNEIGSHTVSHASLPGLDDAHLKMEVTEPKQKLEALLGNPIVTFCYPEGRNNRRVVRAVRDAGYKLAMTCESGSWTSGTPLLQIPRFRIAEQTDLQKCLGGWLSPHRVRPRHRQG